MSEPTITIPKAEFDRLLDAFRSRIVELEQRIVELEAEIRFLENGRDSGTSSTPPSQDLGRSNAQSLREKSGKPACLSPACRLPAGRQGRQVGGQKGHRGCNLALSDAPDVVIPLTPTHCRDCGAELTAVTGELQARRHQPAACLSADRAGRSVRHYLPHGRIAEMFRDLLHLPVSTGTVDNWLSLVEGAVKPRYYGIKRKIRDAAVVGADETGCHVNGAKQLKTLFHTALEYKRQWQTTGTAPPTTELQAQLERLPACRQAGWRSKLRDYRRSYALSSCLPAGRSAVAQVSGCDFYLFALCGSSGGQQRSCRPAGRRQAGARGN